MPPDAPEDPQQHSTAVSTMIEPVLCTAGCALQSLRHTPRTASHPPVHPAETAGQHLAYAATGHYGRSLPGQWCCRRRPVDTQEFPQESWFNICILHQNRLAHQQNAKNCIREDYLARFLDLVLWGHEHESSNSLPLACRRLPTTSPFCSQAPRWPLPYQRGRPSGSTAFSLRSTAMSGAWRASPCAPSAPSSLIQ